MERAKRINAVPPYLFAEIDKKKEAAIERGVDVISLGIGDPDQPTPDHVVERLIEEARKSSNHQYPSYVGHREFRKAVSQYYFNRHGVEVDPGDEAIALIGSKEGLAHMIWAYVEEGDYVLVPDPGYPVYGIHTSLAGGKVFDMPLLAENGYLPDFSAIPEEIAKKAKIMFLNYPNNPTAGVADLSFFEEAVAYGKKYDILICHDAAYTDITFDGYVAPSILEVNGAKDIAIEFGSLSKPYNMTGWRIGYAVGGKEYIDALGIIKTNTDSGQFTAIQKAGIEALLNTPKEFRDSLNSMYQRRRDLVIGSLKEIGIEIPPPKGSFYIWAPVPKGYGSAEFVSLVLEKTGVVLTPGSAYGKQGEGYFRISLSVADDRLEEAMKRLKDLF